jgi:hypothetical protein
VEINGIASYWDMWRQTKWMLENRVTGAEQCSLKGRNARREIAEIQGGEKDIITDGTELPSNDPSSHNARQQVPYSLLTTPALLLNSEKRNETRRIEINHLTISHIT